MGERQVIEHSLCLVCLIDHTLIHSLCTKMAEETTEETQFVVDEVSNIIKESIENTIGGNGYAHAKALQIYCDLCDYAEKWRGFAYSQFVLLGQFYRWKLYCQMGKQDHVLHCFCLWFGYLNKNFKE